MGPLSPPALHTGCGTTGLHMPTACCFSAHGLHMVQSTVINPSQLRLAAVDALFLSAGLALSTAACEPFFRLWSVSPFIIWL